MSFDALETSQYSGQPVELYRFSRGAAVWRYTSADEAQTYNGETYEPTDKIDREAIDQSNEDWAGSIVVTVPRDYPVAALFIPYLPIEPVALVVYRKHRTDTETIPIFIGKISSASFEGSTAKLTAMPVGEALRRTVPILAYQAPCNRVLYSASCGVNREAFSAVGAIAALGADTVQCAAFATKPDGYFALGFARLANGDVRFIVAHTGNTITLMNQFGDVAVGETITAYAGCNLTETTCATKFNNLVNHMGFARVPTSNPYNADIAGMGGNGAAGA